MFDLQKRLCWSVSSLVLLLAPLDFLLAEPYFSPSKSEFLPLEDAFQATAVRGDTRINITWTIAPGYYLYQKKFRFQVLGGEHAQQLHVIPMRGSPVYSPAALEREDEFMGRVMTFSEVVDIGLPVALSADTKALELDMEYQGCAEAGLCYPPSKIKLKVSH